MPSEWNRKVEIESPPVKIEVVSGRSAAVTLITLNHPEQKNPLGWQTIRLLRRAVESSIVEANQNSPRVIVITGSGDSFSAGGDLKGYLDLYSAPSDFKEFLEDFAALCELLEDPKLVSIALINGLCVAGGLELVLACDFAIMADEAIIGDGHLRYGQLPGAGGSQRLIRAIGLARSKDLLLTGRMYSAEEAFASGLVSRICPQEDLREIGLRTAEMVAQHSGEATQLMKQLIGIAKDTTLDEGLVKERQIVLDYATTSSDAREGLLAFVEKRSPKWTQDQE